MRFNRLGTTGIEVSAIALGGHEYLPDGRSRGFNEDMKLAVTPGHIGAGYGGEQRRAVLRQAYDLGINFFDVTIDSEKEALGRNLRELPPPYPFYIQTRPEGMCYSYDEGNRKLLDLDGLRQEVIRILALLGTERIDFLNVGLLQWATDRDPTYLSKLAANIEALKREGLIGYAVADSFSGERLYLEQLDCGAFDAVNLDLNFGDDGGLRTVIPRARAQRLGVIVREAFFKGELFRLAEAAGFASRAEVARAALAWVAQQRPDTVIVGIDNAQQLRANTATLLAADHDRADVSGLLNKLLAVPTIQAYRARKAAEFFGSAE